MQRKPEWLKIKVRAGSNKTAVESLLARLSLHTVCEEAGCPNLMECFHRRTATFMILGNRCTRRCAFCGVGKGLPAPPDPGEPARIAQAIRELGLKHAVITSVTRDDLSDGGAGHFSATIRAIRKDCPGVGIEVLIPDFQGNTARLFLVTDARPDILNHNVETVPRLYPEVRPGASYLRSLKVLENAKKTAGGLLTKSGLMVGLGENEGEVYEVMRDLKMAGCDILTIGQYLAPSKEHYPVYEYIHPRIFQRYRRAAEELGFKHTASGPFVRSSYHAEEAVKSMDVNL
ncbi:MAG: lipoyl synthase [Bacillota bacterium]